MDQLPEIRNGRNDHDPVREGRSEVVVQQYLHVRHVFIVQLPAQLGEGESAISVHGPGTHENRTQKILDRELT